MARSRELKILSWNIDGLDKEELDVRTIAVSEVINNSLADVIMLQEVVDESLTVLQALCPSYEFVVHQVAHYYTIVMLKTDENLTFRNKNIVEYPSTSMGRYLLKCSLVFFGQTIVVMATHLESTKEAKFERKNQLRICFDSMSSTSDNEIIVFAGDLNIREQEIKELGGLPAGVLDSWVVNGSKPNVRFTWDLMQNDNLQFAGSSQPRARYDRMFFKAAEDKEVQCTSFLLVGMERIEACRKFPSDHFGILATLNYRE
ncbi:tyrosyl-DNA phosphodiesterase 2-like isoform X1 [Hydractinia symbiolongicarpus]|uniref:tyrosyl-DNA phosphodiesterase 2-like isoform X1 n=1 Tax=Hydractinia symbiolongicarpus TaxID=13093 RepID=UPI00254D766D|nr:tyrosyl-DNA phosphodiesterase 2-like isoform X1 [Hydractinia symbiolongicarpus]